MHKKLSLDSLSSEKAALLKLLDSADENRDIVGKIQLRSRLTEIENRIQELGEPAIEDNSAKVAIYFGGKPTLGSKGINSKFAGAALDKFQNLVYKTFASNRVDGDLGQRGKVPFRDQCQLMVTGVARGSFGFILDEESEQVENQPSSLSITIDQAAQLLDDMAAQDQARFERALEALDNRTLKALKEFFSVLNTHEATFRIVEKSIDYSFDRRSIFRAVKRTEDTTIKESEKSIDGVLSGVLPEGRKFELKDDSGKLYSGSIDQSVLDKFGSDIHAIIGKNCCAGISIKTVTPFNQEPRETYRLVSLTQIHE